MSAVNPYQPPQASVADVVETSGARSQPRVWAARGRIGRLRYLAYTSVGSLAIYLIAAILGGLLSVAIGPSGLMVAIVLAYIPILVLVTLALIQRSHDMGWSGWTALLALIPFAALIWLFKAGTPGDNRWGAPPVPNSTGVKVAVGVAFIFPAVIGILAAISIPAYQSYVERAKAAQQNQGQPAPAPEAGNQ